MLTVDQFVAQMTGQAASYDGLPVNYGQCEQLVCAFWKEVYGFICPMIPYAKDLYNNPTILQHFSRIPAGQEQKGDVAVFGASSAINSPVAGHTDIVLAKESNGFLGFDSNWGGVKVATGKPHAGYPAAHQVVHSHVDVVGFLRHKGAAAPPPPVFPKTVVVKVPVLNVRSAPNASAPLSGSRKLPFGTPVRVVGQVAGQNVGGINKWYKSVFGNYIWSGGVKG